MKNKRTLLLLLPLLVLLASWIHFRLPETLAAAPDTVRGFFMYFWAGILAVVFVFDVLMQGKSLGYIPFGAPFRKAPSHLFWDAQNNYFSLFLGVGIVLAVPVFTIPAFTAPAPPLSVEGFRKVVEQRDALGHVDLGYRYLNGQGVAKDEVEAVKWFRKAADQGDAKAQSSLGVMYDNGQGVVKDEVEAVKWFRKAAEQGYSIALSNLGVMYANGRVVLPNLVVAYALYSLSASIDPSEKNKNRAGLAKSLPPNEIKAVHNLTREIAKPGNLRKALDMYANGQAIATGEVEAVARIHKDVEQQKTLGQTTLCWSYRNGQGVAKDEVEAVKWVRKMAEQGDATCQTNLGYMYLSGQGVVMNYAEAVKWFRIAAERGDAEGQLHLGMMYFYGKSVPKDEVEAVKWLRKAAEQGNEQAIKILRR